MPLPRALSEARIAADLGQILRFGLVGIVSTLIHGMVASAYLLTGGGSALRANLLGYCAALSWSFTGNLYWVFRFKGRMRDVFPRFLAFSLAALALSLSISAITDRAGLSPYWALATVVLTIPAFSYVTSRFLIFR